MTKNDLKQKAFSLIELLVVISIIALIASIIIASIDGARKHGRDAFRRSSLKQLQAALSLYYSANHSYPSTSGQWFGESSGYGSYGYTGGGGYIPNLAPNYIGTLPSDPQVNVGQGGSCAASSAGFVYRSDGINYKLLANCVIEIPVQRTDPFYDPVRPTSALQISTSGAFNW